MAKAGRCESVTVTGDVVVLKITHGASPLPSAWQGEALNFASKAEFVSAIEELESRISGQDLALLQAAAAYKADPSMKTTFVTKCADKTCVLDLTGAVAPITVQG